MYFRTHLLHEGKTISNAAQSSITRNRNAITTSTWCRNTWYSLFTTEKLCLYIIRIVFKSTCQNEAQYRRNVNEIKNNEL